MQMLKSFSQKHKVIASIVTVLLLSDFTLVAVALPVSPPVLVDCVCCTDGMEEALQCIIGGGNPNCSDFGELFTFCGAVDCTFEEYFIIYPGCEHGGLDCDDEEYLCEAPIQLLPESVFK